MYHFVYMLFFHFLFRLVSLLSSRSSLWLLPSDLLANVAMTYNYIAGTCYVLSCVVFRVVPCLCCIVSPVQVPIPVTVPIHRRIRFRSLQV